MSSTTTRVPLDEARGIADSLVGLLGLSCVRIEIAGSIRRERSDIGDIDLVCEPIIEPLVDMFGEPSGDERDRLHERMDDLERIGTLGKRRNALGQAAWGHALKRATYHGLGVDVQAARDRTTWGAWLAIRTGPGLFSKWLVSQRSNGGALSPGMEFKHGFRLYKHGGPVPTPTEFSLFDAIGIDYIPPQDRDAFVKRMVK